MWHICSACTCLIGVDKADLLKLGNIPFKTGKPLGHRVALARGEAILLHQLHQITGVISASESLANDQN